MMVMMNLKDNNPEQLELFVEEEEPLPTWGEIVRDPESVFILFSLVSVIGCLLYTSPSPRDRG